MYQAETPTELCKYKEDEKGKLNSEWIHLSLYKLMV